MADKDPNLETPAAPPSPAASPSNAAPAPASTAPPQASAAEAAGAPSPQPESTPSLLQEVVAARDAKEQPAPTDKAPDAKAPEGGTGEDPAKKTPEPAADAKPDAAKTAEPPKPEDKKAEEKKPEEKAAEAKPTDKPAEPPKAPEPVEYKYTLPDTIKLDDAMKTKTHAAFDAFRADPTNPQPLIDLHNQAMTDYAAQVALDQRKIFNETRKAWRNEIMADAEIGGAGHQTAAGAVARMRDMLVPASMLQPRKFDDGSPRLSVFDEFLEVTGAGDHPALWHLLHNAARYLDEPQAKDLPTNPRPTRVNAPRGRMRDLYTHPRSNGGA